MNLGEIRDEVVAAGFRDYEGNGLVDSWINRALREIENQQPWPWRIKVTTATAPYSNLTDLQQVYKVTCGGSTVDYEDYRNVVDRDPALEETGDPIYWYMRGFTFNTWPATTRQLQIVYLCTPEQLSGDSDEPEMPEAYHDLIVTGARIRAFRHTQSFEAAAIERQEWQLGISELSIAFGRRNFDSDMSIQRKGYPGDY